MKTIMSAYLQEERLKERMKHHFNICPSILSRQNTTGRKRIILTKEGLDRDKHICLACRYGLKDIPEECRMFNQLHKRYAPFIVESDKLHLSVKDMLFVRVC